MTISLRPVDDCIITVPDVGMLAVHESQKQFQECPLINVSCQRKDGRVDHFEEIVDLEVF